MKEVETMSPDHPLWDKFTKRLEGPEGCNFQGTGYSATWKCGGGRDKSLAEAILKTMPDIDVADSLALFEGHGGYCDCEILFNVRR